MEIKDNTTVKIHYKGTLDDGSVFDSSEGKDALEFIIGLGMIIPGLEEGIKGLKVGDKKTVKVESNDAYGPVMEEAKQEVPKSQFPPELQVEVGMQLAAQGPQGVIPVTISEIRDDSILVDFNHPLAGKNLTFDIEVLEVRETSEEEINKLMEAHSHHHEHEHEHENSGCCGGGKCSEDEKKNGECCGKGDCK